MRGYRSWTAASSTTVTASPDARMQLQAASRSGPPDPASLLRHKLSQPARLQPSDLLALPVPCGGGLTAVLMLGWGVNSQTPPAGAAAWAPGGAQDPDTSDPSQQPPRPQPRRLQPPKAGNGGSRGHSWLCGAKGDAGCGGRAMEVSAQDLADLQRLAQILVFGVMGDERQARLLEAVARRLPGLHMSPSLQHFATCLLDAVPELLHIRFGLHFQPVLLLSHGVADDAPSILLAKRHLEPVPAQGGGNLVYGDAGSGQPIVIDPWVFASTDGSSCDALGVQSLRLGEQQDTALRGSRVRAVRVSPRQTLLAETLSCPSTVAAGAGASHSPGHASFRTTAIPNVASYLLEDGAPCADLILCSNLLGGRVGSCVLCAQTAPAASSAAPSLPHAPTAAPTANVTPASLLADVIGRLPDGCSDLTGSGTTAPAAATAAGDNGTLLGRGCASVEPSSRAAGVRLLQLQRALQSQRQFGMYLLCEEPLPRALLEEVAVEVQELLGMVLQACQQDGGPLSPSDIGRCNAELYSLQQQALGLGPSLRVLGSGLLERSATGGSNGAMGAAAGSTIGTGASAGAGAYNRASSGVDAAGNGDGGHGSDGSRRLRAPKVPPSAGILRAKSGGLTGFPDLSLYRSHMARRLGSLLPARAAAPSSQGASRTVSLAQIMLANRSLGSARPERIAGPVSGPAAMDEDATTGVLMATAPGILLESAAGDVSPMQAMVSSMRSGLSAAVSSAMAVSSGEESRIFMGQELDAIRLKEMIGHGGQGIVIRGTLHGLETAIKIIAAKASSHPRPAAGDHGGGEADPGVGDTPEDEYADLAKAKRGALELVVTGALSHPNIVQVLASISEVVLARCASRDGGSPQLKLFAKDDPALVGTRKAGLPNTVLCLEYCDKGTLLSASRNGAFRLSGAPADSTGVARVALVPLLMSLLEIALALRYLHSRRLVHCDLKPANVLLKSSPRDPRGWTCKLSDFGCVRLMTEVSGEPDEGRRRLLQAPQLAGQAHPYMQQAQHQASQAAGTAGRQPGKATVPGFRNRKVVGTVPYMAPECFVRGSTLGPGVDIYAFGILMWELLMCRTPYHGLDPKAVPRLVSHHHRPDFAAPSPLDYVHLASRCWSAHASRRPTAAQLVCELEGMLESARRAAATAAAAATASSEGGGRRLRPLPATAGTQL